MDALTGLPTHLDLRERLPALLATGRPAAGVFLDLDGFAWVNMQEGHAAADEILARLGRWLAEHADELGASAFRIGGDEFLLILPGSTPGEARTAAEVLLADWAALHIPYSRPGHARDHVTLSAVVFPVTTALGDGVPGLRDAAAQRLYEGQLAAGRDFGIVTTLD